MCGICGSVGSADAELVRRMTAVQAHRGPDGEGIELFPSSNGGVPAALGHRRLSIIDPSERGAQPMCDSGGRYWITYNGELYNFRALRAELEAGGDTFASDCDTEVLLAMYARHGRRMLERLNGIFAFAIWDTERRELFIARDRLGVKPLYYAWHDGSFYFASEAKALLEAIGRPSMRVELLSQYLSFLWVPEPDTLFERIMKLAPGHCGVLRDGRLELSEYWDLSYLPDAGEAHWAERLHETVDAAVRRQMVSDVPLGAFLSGGVDSSGVVAAMNRAAGEVTSYSIGFAPEDQAHEITPDDLAYARRVAADLGVDNHERVLDPAVVDLLPRLVWHLDEPIADPAAISSYLICAAARERLTVILSGMGADEVFAGYPRHLAAKLTRHADLIPRRLRSALREALAARLTMGSPGRTRRLRRNALEVLRGIDLPGIERYLAYSAYYRPQEIADLLTPEAAALAAPDPFARHREHALGAAGTDWLSQILYIDLKTFLPSLNLAYTDKMSMAASTEVRVPLLDDELISLAARIPSTLKLHRRTGKYVLKEAMRGSIPDYVIDRPKAGIGAPIRSWLLGDLKPLVHDLLSPSVVAERGLFDPKAVQRLLRENEQGVADHALRVWTLVVLELWQRTFIDGEPGPVSAIAATRGGA